MAFSSRFTSTLLSQASYAERAFPESRGPTINLPPPVKNSSLPILPNITAVRERTSAVVTALIAESIGIDDDDENDNDGGGENTNNNTMGTGMRMLLVAPFPSSLLLSSHEGGKRDPDSPAEACELGGDDGSEITTKKQNLSLNLRAQGREINDDSTSSFSLAAVFDVLPKHATANTNTIAAAMGTPHRRRRAPEAPLSLPSLTLSPRTNDAATAAAAAAFANSTRSHRIWKKIKCYFFNSLKNGTLTKTLISLSSSRPPSLPLTLQERLAGVLSRFGDVDELDAVDFAQVALQVSPGNVGGVASNIEQTLRLKRRVMREKAAAAASLELMEAQLLQETAQIAAEEANLAAATERTRAYHAALAAKAALPPPLPRVALRNVGSLGLPPSDDTDNIAPRAPLSFSHRVPTPAEGGSLSVAVRRAAIAASAYDDDVTAVPRVVSSHEDIENILLHHSSPEPLPRLLRPTPSATITTTTVAPPPLQGVVDRGNSTIAAAERRFLLWSEQFDANAVETERGVLLNEAATWVPKRIPPQPPRQVVKVEGEEETRTVPPPPRSHNFLSINDDVQLIAESLIISASPISPLPPPPMAPQHGLLSLAETNFGGKSTTSDESRWPKDTVTPPKTRLLPSLQALAVALRGEDGSNAGAALPLLALPAVAAVAVDKGQVAAAEEEEVYRFEPPQPALIQRAASLGLVSALSLVDRVLASAATSSAFLASAFSPSFIAGKTFSAAVWGGGGVLSARDLEEKSISLLLKEEERVTKGNDSLELSLADVNNAATSTTLTSSQVPSQPSLALSPQNTLPPSLVPPTRAEPLPPGFSRRAERFVEDITVGNNNSKGEAVPLAAVASGLSIKELLVITRQSAVTSAAAAAAVAMKNGNNTPPPTTTTATTATPTVIVGALKGRIASILEPMRRG